MFPGWEIRKCLLKFASNVVLDFSLADLLVHVEGHLFFQVYSTCREESALVDGLLIITEL